MNKNSQPIVVTYSDEKLRILVEGYIARQKTDFTFKGVCAYVLYWAMEDGKTADTGNMLYESNQLAQDDQARIMRIIETIVADGRVVKAAGAEPRYVKQ